LRLDALKTDYFHDEAYPTYLYFNPYDEDKVVDIDVGTGSSDLYDAVSNIFLQTGVSGAGYFMIPADAAVLLVLVPTGGIISYDLDRMLVDDVVVDYRSGQVVGNYPPRIKSLASMSELVMSGVSTTVYCTAVDQDSDPLTYLWSSTGGTIENNNPTVQWTAPDQMGTYTISCVIDDGNGGMDSAQVIVEVVELINHEPVIDSLTANPQRVHLGSTSQLICYAHDPDLEVLTYTWNAEYGTLDTQDSTATWTAPDVQGFYYIQCTVEDGHSGSAVDSIGIVVQDTSNISTGIPVAYYPFNGNANDESGNNHHGTVKGAVLTDDKMGTSNSAYSFNGSFDLIQVPNHNDLNFQNAITVSLWMKAEELYTNRESYPISHGNWENRWKLSIIPQKKLRWTVKTNLGIKDLDSQTVLVEDT